jgi:hypothetical protein
LSSLPEPPEIAQRRAHLGIVEVRDCLMADAIVEPTPLPPGGRPSGIMVRGAKHGGSPFLNVVSRAAMLVSILAVLALGGGMAYGLTRFARWVASPRAGAPATPMVSRGDGAQVQCAAGGLSAADGIPAVREAAAIVLGRKVLPRDARAIARLGARTVSDASGNRVDIFQPQGVKLAVAYAAQSAIVRAVSISFDSPRTPCVALEMAGLLAGSTIFRVNPSGAIGPVGGTIDPFFAAGGVARAKFVEDHVQILQLDSPVAAPR